MTGKQAYLEKAKLIWKFILSGKDDVLGGGVYWCEQKKESKILVLMHREPYSLSNYFKLLKMMPI